MLEQILIFTLLGSIGGLAGGVILLSREKLVLKISHFLASFAAGVLLGTAFFDLLPEALEQSDGKSMGVLSWTLVGMVAFFLLERFIHWFHHHEEFHQEDQKSKSTLALIIFGDTIHNFVDGIVIASTFMVNAPLGVVTALAVFAHELPQEIGDFGLMLHKGLGRKKIIMVNILSAAVSFIGAIGTYILGSVLNGFLPIFLALTAGFFIYIASSDLIPEIHYEKRKGFAQIESFLLIVGIIVVWASVTLLSETH